MALQPNDEREKKSSVNTRGIQLYNSDSVDSAFPPSTVILGYWDEKFMSIRIHPAKEVQTEKEKFDYDHSLQVSVNYSNAVELLDGIPRIKEAFDKGEAANCYAVVSGTNLFGYGCAKNKKGDMVMYLAIHTDLNNDRIPKNSIYFEFPFGNRVEDYDVNTGSYTAANAKYGEFPLFETYLREFVKGSTKAVAHSTRTLLHFLHRRYDAKLDGIVEATNAQVNLPDSGRRGSYRPNLFGGGGASTPATTAEAAETSQEAVDEELPF